MITFFSKWAQGIIVAIIIATIIEMILPRGTSKKYVKVVIGMYVLFTIVSPIIQKVSKGVDLSNVFNPTEYEDIMEKSDKTMTQKLEADNNKTIKDIYESNLGANIKSEIQSKGYEVTSTYVKVKDDGNYTIEKVSLEIRKDEKEKANKNEQNTIKINEINISISNIVENTTKDATIITTEEQNKLKEYISQTYNINTEIIEIR